MINQQVHGFLPQDRRDDAGSGALTATGVHVSYSRGVGASYEQGAPAQCEVLGVGLLQGPRRVRV